MNAPSYSPTISAGGSPFSTPSPVFIVYRFFDDGHFARWGVEHRHGVLISFLYMQLSSFPRTTYWKDYLLSVVYSCLLCHRYTCLSWSFLSPFHWSIFLFACQYHALLFTVAVWYNLKLGNLDFPSYFSCSRLLWLFGVFCVSIQIVKIFALVLWKMLLLI